MRTKNTSFWLGCIAVIATALSVEVLYWANNKMPFGMDDDWYSTNLVTGNPIDGFGDIWESQVWHFFHWGGRNIAHTLLQITLWAGPTVADITNVVITFLLVIFIMKLAKISNYSYGLMVLGFLIFLNANWAQTLLWQSGVANYLYMTTGILIFLFCYLGVVENPEFDKPFGINWWIALLGIFSGWSNENMGPAVWVGTFGVILYCWKKERKIQLWMIVGNIFCLIGCVLVVLAPGNFVRNMEISGQVTGKGLIWRVFLRCFSVTNGLFHYLLYPVILLLILMLIYHYLLGKKYRLSDMFLIFMAMLSWGAMILSPHYPDRAAFGTMVLLLVPIMHMFVEIHQSRKELMIPGYGVVLFVWLAGMFTLCTYICQRIGWIQ